MSENNYCKKCFYANRTDQNLFFDHRGFCTGCQNAEEADNFDWDRRFEKLKKLFSNFKSENKYDILIGVSGGKEVVEKLTGGGVVEDASITGDAFVNMRSFSTRKFKKIDGEFVSPFTGAPTAPGIFGKFIEG